MAFEDRFPSFTGSLSSGTPTVRSGAKRGNSTASKKWCTGSIYASAAIKVRLCTGAAGESSPLPFGGDVLSVPASAANTEAGSRFAFKLTGCPELFELRADRDSADATFRIDWGLE